MGLCFLDRGIERRRPRESFGGAPIVFKEKHTHQSRDGINREMVFSVLVRAESSLKNAANAVLTQGIITSVLSHAFSSLSLLPFNLRGEYFIRLMLSVIA